MNNCPFDDNKLCPKTSCLGCEEVFKAMERANAELGLCPVCGSDIPCNCEVKYGSLNMS